MIKFHSRYGLIVAKIHCIVKITLQFCKFYFIHESKSFKGLKITENFISFFKWICWYKMTSLCKILPHLPSDNCFQSFIKNEIYISFHLVHYQYFFLLHRVELKCLRHIKVVFKTSLGKCIKTFLILPFQELSGEWVPYLKVPLLINVSF